MRLTDRLKFYADVQRPYKKRVVDGIVIITQAEIMLIEKLEEVVWLVPLIKVQKLGVSWGMSLGVLWESAILLVPVA